MIRKTHDGLAYYEFESMSAGQVRHALFTRLGGISKPPFDTLNLGMSVGDDPSSVAANRDSVYAALGVRGGNVATCYAVHGTRFAVVTPRDLGKGFPGTDGLLTNVRGAILTLRFADCVPLLLHDPRRGAVALVHAGWQGTASRISELAVLVMTQAFGSDPADLVAGLGPSIGPCCYQVGAERAAEFLHLWPEGGKHIVSDESGSHRLDLWGANVRQLYDRGVRHIEIGGLCTCCRRDEFFSHRGDGGRTGRFAVGIGLLS